MNNEQITIAQNTRYNSPIKLRVLEPTTINAATRIVYLLPVITGKSFGAFGDPIASHASANTANTANVILINPQFTTDAFGPWYVKYEKDYLKNKLFSYVEGTLYPEITEERVLAGFSKSGWGILSLILEDPSICSTAVIFDAPLTMSAADFNSDYIFGSNFALYDLNSRVAGGSIGDVNLILSGWKLFETEMDDMSALLTSNAIAHTYDKFEDSIHSWAGGWRIRLRDNYL